MAWDDSPLQFQVQCKGALQSQICYVNLWYYQLTNPSTSVDLIDFMDTVVDELITRWKAVQTSSFVWTQASIHGRGAGQTGKQLTRPLTLAGDVADEALPAWDTWSFYKAPDNTQKDPDTAEDFRLGRFALSGVPETWVADGYVSEISLFELNAAVIHTATMPQKNGTRDWGLYMIRYEPVAGYAGSVPVLECGFNRLGTQLTRKD